MGRMKDKLFDIVELVTDELYRGNVCTLDIVLTVSVDHEITLREAAEAVRAITSDNMLPPYRRDIDNNAVGAIQWAVVVECLQDSSESLTTYFELETAGQ